MEQLQEIAQKSLFGITFAQYTLAFIFILAGYLAKFIMNVVLKRAQKVAKTTKNEFDDVILEAIIKPIRVALVLSGIWMAVGVLALPSEPVNVHQFVHSILKASMIVLATWMAVRLSDSIFTVLSTRVKETPSPLDDHLLPIARKTLRSFLLIIGGVIIIQDLGYSVSSLLAGLGIGGMALALASKDTLSNIFGSLVIFIDRPFVVGDWIEMGDVEGTVEEVGLRVTRIRTFANSLITLPNAQLTTTFINNWSRMKKRRIKLNIGITYDSSPDKINQAVTELRRIIREDPKMHHDFFLVNFNAFGPSSLDIFIYCFTVTTDWAEYLQVRQELLLKFMTAVQDLGLEFAFPSQTIYMADGSGPPAEMGSGMHN